MLALCHDDITGFVYIVVISCSIEYWLWKQSV